MHPIRLSMVTYNLWNTQRWPERAPALASFLGLFAPDILCVQELQEPTQAFLDRTLQRRSRVRDALPGWTGEGNIYWNADLLEEVEHGAEEVLQPEKDRRLFWARLRVKGTERTVFVSTAHLTPPGNAEELASGLSPRVAQLRRIAACLGRLPLAGEAAFFMGDMNDARHPQRLLKQAGFTSCFAALGVQSPPTFKCCATARVPPGEPCSTEAIDLIVANRHARAVSASVPQCYFEDLTPSDHWPVQAVYELL